MRMATLLGGNDLLIGKARKAVVEKSSNAGALLEAVPAAARNDAGYIFHKAQWLRRDDKAIEAARLLQSAPRSASQQHNLDEWWVERRLRRAQAARSQRIPGRLPRGARRAAAAEGKPARRA